MGRNIRRNYLMLLIQLNKPMMVDILLLVNPIHIMVKLLEIMVQEITGL